MRVEHEYREGACELLNETGSTNARCNESFGNLRDAALLRRTGKVEVSPQAPGPFDIQRLPD